MTSTDGPVSGYRYKKRVSFQAPVLITDGTIETRLECLDLANGGLGVEGSWLWPEGSRVTVRVLLGERSAVARAQVVHSEDGRMGLRLLVQGPMFTRLLGMLFREAA